MFTKADVKSPVKVNSASRRVPKPAKWNNVVESRDAQYQLKKNAVIAEASRAFGRRGDQNVSLDEIAKALHVTKPALYYYFKNKQELIYECHELAMSIGDRALEQAVASEGSGYARIQSFVRSYVDLLTNELGAPALLHDISSMTAVDQKKILARRRAFDHQLRQVLEDGVRDGSVVPCDCKLAVFWFMGAITSIPQWFHDEGRLSGEQVADIFSGFLARGIQQAAAGAVVETSKPKPKPKRKSA